MRGADLSRTVIRDTDFAYADLTDADLSMANGPGGTSFQSSILVGANLTGVRLERPMFWGADLTGADFTGATLRVADMSNTNLTRTIFRGVKFKTNPLSTDAATGSLLAAGATFDKTDLREAILPEADLAYSNFSAARGYY